VCQYGSLLCRTGLGACQLMGWELGAGAKQQGWPNSCCAEQPFLLLLLLLFVSCRSAAVMLRSWSTHSPDSPSTSSVPCAHACTMTRYVWHCPGGVHAAVGFSSSGVQQQHFPGCIGV
jgi:hypothetical protein